MQAQSNTLNCKEQNIYAGIDVHKKSWTVCIYSQIMEKEHRIFSQPPSAEALRAHLHRHYPGATYYSVYEAGFCGFHVHEELTAAGINNRVVNPADVPTTHKEKANKNDKRDSRKLGRSLRSHELEAIHIPARKTQEDRSLVRMRCTIRKDLSRIKSRIKMLLNFYGIDHPDNFSSPSTHWSRRYIEWLKTIPMTQESGRAALQALISEAVGMRKVLLTVTRKIRVLSQTEAYAKDYELVLSIKGVGLIAGMSLLTEIEDISRFPSTDRIASYVGLTPSCHDTGNKKNHGGITSRKHEILCEMLIESAWKASRDDPALRLAFRELTKRMKPNKAIIRIARKLLNRIYYVLKNKQKYECEVVK